MNSSFIRFLFGFVVFVAFGGFWGFCGEEVCWSWVYIGLRKFVFVLWFWFWFGVLVWLEALSGESGGDVHLFRFGNSVVGFSGECSLWRIVFLLSNIDGDFFNSHFFSFCCFSFLSKVC